MKLTKTFDLTKDLNPVQASTPNTPSKPTSTQRMYEDDLRKKVIQKQAEKTITPSSAKSSVKLTKLIGKELEDSTFAEDMSPETKARAMKFRQFKFHNVIKREDLGKYILMGKNIREDEGIAIASWNLSTPSHIVAQELSSYSSTPIQRPEILQTMITPASTIPSTEAEFSMEDENPMDMCETVQSNISIKTCPQNIIIQRNEWSKVVDIAPDDIIGILSECNCRNHIAPNCSLHSS